MKLRESQEVTKRFIIDKKRCLIMNDMGFGKTATCLHAIKELLDNKSVKRVLVVAPLRVALNVWHSEIENWKSLRGLTYSILAQLPESRRLEAMRRDVNIHIINREMVYWLVNEWSKVGKWPWDMVVIDESSSFTCGKAKRMRAMKAIAQHTKYMVLMSGTPAANGLGKLWGQIFLIDGGKRLGKSQGVFEKWYCEQKFTMFQTPKIRDDKIKLIHEKISDVSLSIPIEDEGLGKVDMIEYVELNDYELNQYRRMEEEAYLEIAGTEITAVNSAAILNKLLQIANGNVYDKNKSVNKVHSRKLSVLKEIMNENEENMIIVYNFLSDKDDILSIPGTVLLDNQKAIFDWNKGRIKYLVMHPASGGHGLNLQYGGSIIVWFGVPWSLEFYQQTNKRLERPGQDKVVRIVHLLTKDTIDIDVFKRLNSKATIQNDMIDYVKERYANIRRDIQERNQLA